jgi:DNA topoisomerase 2-associated protein PAT1
MSFFRFETSNLEDERRQFLDGGMPQEGSDVPVYTWGTDNYDELGDAFQERGDELNDETFGASGPVGMYWF